MQTAKDDLFVLNKILEGKPNDMKVFNNKKIISNYFIIYYYIFIIILLL
jgi:hypothetical protein